jgi:hypothetical protein
MGCKQLYVNLGGSGGGSVGTGVLQIAGSVPLDATLRNVADQNNTDSPLQLSTTNVSVFSPSGSGNERRLIMDSGNDASAKIFSFRTGGLQRWAFRVDGTESGSNAGGNLAIRRYNDAGSLISALLTLTRSTGAISITPDAATFSGGTNTRTMLDLAYTINTTGGTNTITGLNINVTNTSLTGSTSLPFRLQRAGTTLVAVQTDNSGAYMGVNQTPSSAYWLFGTGGSTSRVLSSGGYNVGSSDRLLTINGLDFTNNDMAINSGTGLITMTAGRIRLSGTTSSFPALKRSGTTVQIRLADDSAYGNIDASRYFSEGTQGVSGTFTSNDGKTITATNGIITAIV